ncbi:DUF4252 domain-containing protein [Lutibacter flavus]|uniref:DUF4252 domain-containing protein n=1 Tax=Lutibacter flavus TaxID=691689 RepID=A0A238VMR8_9FLAO|nr:DUF4252 domain-containing protein [Lutibacter flavus]SNR35655.1 protein of unknown function [Lutibacter flavus]
MRSIVKNIGIVLVLMLTLIACDNNTSLQKYYVDSKENNEFISIDLPASILELKDENVSEDVRKTLQTINKINFLALQLTETNKELYSSEKEKVKLILKNSAYKQLMRMNLGKGSVVVNYLGEEDAIDEVIIFGSDNEKGFAVVRVTGDKMNPNDIMKLANDIKLDGDSDQFKQLEGLFSSIK